MRYRVKYEITVDFNSDLDFDYDPNLIPDFKDLIKDGDYEIVDEWFIDYDSAPVKVKKITSKAEIEKLKKVFKND